MLRRGFACSAWLVVLLLVATSVHAQTQSHLEACTQWNVEKGKVGFWNKCGQPVVVNFMQLNAKKPIARTVNADARFDTGRTPAALKSSGWMSTRCAVGYSPDVPFKVENRTSIIDSKYQCQKQ
jgi:hypothetical protein